MNAPVSRRVIVEAGVDVGLGGDPCGTLSGGQVCPLFDIWLPQVIQDKGRIRAAAHQFNDKSHPYSHNDCHSSPSFSIGATGPVSATLRTCLDCSYALVTPATLAAIS